MSNSWLRQSPSNRSLINRAMVLLAGLILAASAGRTLAQSAAAPAGASAAAPIDQLQEITVTAQFRTENVQSIPLAITAIDASQLAARSETNISQVAASVPSVTLLQSETAFGPSMTAYIRGIGQYDQDPALEPGVGIYIDDVYFGTLTGSLLDLLDLDRVEVLRGPQGTLEGMNSEGGAIKLFSQKPDGSGDSSISALYGSRNHIESRGMTNITLVPDQLFVRVSAVYNHQDGYVNVFDFGCSVGPFTATSTTGVTGTYTVAPQFLTHAGSCLRDQEGGTDYQALRLSARWVPTDSVEVNIAGDITQQDQENPATTLLHAQPPTYPVTLSATNTATGATAQLPYSQIAVPSIIAPNRYTSYAGFSMPASGSTPAYYGNDNSDLLSWGSSGTVDWKINEMLALKSISAFRGYSATWYEDNDDSAWPLGLGGEYLQHHQFSEELRLNGSYQKLVDYTIGGFYFDETTTYGTHQDLWYAAGPGALDFLGDDPIPAKDKAGYLHTVWHLTDKLNFTAAGRYTSQTKEYTYVRTNPEGGSGGGAALVSSLNGVTGYYTGHKTDYRGVIDYHWTDDLMTYAQASTGFKGGGVNPRPFFAFQAVAFQPEDLTTYELGIKSSWWGNKLRANLDVYSSLYSNIQLTLLNCGFLNPPGFPIPPAFTPCALPLNAGTARIKGAEFELQAQPVPGLQVNAQASVLQFSYTELTSLPTGVTYGMVTPYTPKWQASLGIQYKIQLSSYGTLTPRLDANTRTDVYTNPVNGPLNHLGGYTVYNARITWRPENEKWEASLVALNLTDHFYYLNNFDLTGAGGGSVTGSPAPPAEVALEVKRKF